jgi:two-component system, OmpR family, alkaline phosphatase synthesis response regulator PhoP
MFVKITIGLIKFVVLKTQRRSFMAKKVLVVEDEPSLAKILQFDLETAGFLVKSATNGAEAYRMVQKEKFDCFIIDWMIPNMTGLDLIKKLRAEKNKALFVMLTAKTSEFDAIEGLSSGADLYLKKPISNRELIAQVKALMGHYQPENKIEEDSLEFADVLVDLKQFKVHVHGEQVELTKMEFDLLKFFIINKEQALSRDTILNAIWGFEYDGTTRIVDVHVYNLKKKLAHAACYFKPVRGVGYALLLA